MRLEVGGLEADSCVTGRVGFVEAVSCERLHEMEQLFCCGLLDSRSIMPCTNFSRCSSNNSLIFLPFSALIL